LNGNLKLNTLSSEQKKILDEFKDGKLNIDVLKTNNYFKINGISISNNIKELIEMGLIKSIESRYDFKNAKISSGLFGINRIFLPRSNIFSTLVASDSNDYVALKNVYSSKLTYKEEFINEVFLPRLFRRLTKEECCLTQGFPFDFKLPDTRSRWMRLIGNSVSVPVIKLLAESMIMTGVFEKYEK